MKEILVNHYVRYMRWVLFALWGALIGWLSLTASPPKIDVGFLGWDKFQHAAAYGVLTALGGWASDEFPARRMRRWLIIALIAAVCGGFLEMAQGLFTKTRTPEWGDLLADVVGAIGVCISVALIRARKTGSKKNSTICF